MMERKPKVSVGLPVFNGEKYLNEAIDSILCQSFTDFELIICDNASFDRTEEICQDYAAQDSRIRYYRNKTNIGGSRNQNLTIELSQGEYFHLGAHDDLLDPDLLAKSVEVLDRNSSVVLCYSLMFEIDDCGNILSKIEPADLATSIDPDRRFSNLLEGHRVDFLYGLIRIDTLRKTELEPPYPQADSIFACELALNGQFWKIPEYLYYRRIHGEACTNLDLRGQLRWNQIAIKNDSQWMVLLLTQYYANFGLFWLEASHFSRIICRASLTSRERIFCCLYATLWLFKRHFVPDILKRFYRKIYFKHKSIEFNGSSDSVPQ
jgi:glycosyltransferase involved in cell wall biosynthesis